MGYGVLMKISVLIASFNYGNFIEDAIKSVLEQNYPRELYEIIVVDACSTDDTEKILDKYRSEIKVIYQHESTGLAAGCNLGIRASSGEYIVRLDADDTFCQNVLLIESLFLDENPDIGFTYPDYFVQKNGVKRRFCLPDFDADEIKQRGDFLGGGTMYRKELFNKYGLYDETFRSIENYELVLRYLENGIRGLHIKLPLFTYNHHGDSMSDDTKSMVDAWNILEIKYGNKYKMGKNHPRNIEF